MTQQIIIFHAYNPRNTDQIIEASNINEALIQYMQHFKSKKVSIIEYRNGEHRATIGGNGDNYYRKTFSRDEAKKLITT